MLCSHLPRRAHFRYIDADQEFRAALEAKANASPKEDEKTAIMLNNLGATCEKLHQPREADKLYRRAIAICEVTLPTGHARTEHIRSKLKALQVNRAMQPAPPLTCILAPPSLIPGPRMHSPPPLTLGPRRRARANEPVATGND